MGQSLGLALDPRSGAPIYQQIFDQIVARIRSGAFPAGFRLPPTRTLAGELATHRNTVVRALRGPGERRASCVSTVGRGHLRRRRSRPRRSRPRRRAPASCRGRRSCRARRRRAARARRAHWRAGAAADDAINLTRMQPSADLLPARADAALHRPRAADAGRTRARLRAAAKACRGCASSSPRTSRARACPRRPRTFSSPPAASRRSTSSRARSSIPGDTFLVDATTYARRDQPAHARRRAAGRRPRATTKGPTSARSSGSTRGGAKGFYLMPNCAQPDRRRAISARAPRRARRVVAATRACRSSRTTTAPTSSLDGAPPPPALRALDGDVIYVGDVQQAAHSGAARRLPGVPASAAPALCRDQAHHRPRHVGAPAARARRVPRARLPARASRPRSLPEYRARRDALDAALSQAPAAGVAWRVPSAASSSGCRFRRARSRGGLRGGAPPAACSSARARSTRSSAPRRAGSASRSAPSRRSVSSRARGVSAKR